MYVVKLTRVEGNAIVLSLSVIISVILLHMGGGDFKDGKPPLSRETLQVPQDSANEVLRWCAYVGDGAFHPHIYYRQDAGEKQNRRRGTTALSST